MTLVLVPMVPLDVSLLGFEVFENDQAMETLQTLMEICSADDRLRK